MKMLKLLKLLSRVCSRTKGPRHFTSHLTQSREEERKMCPVVYKISEIVSYLRFLENIG